MLKTDGIHHGFSMSNLGVSILPGQYERANDGTLVEIEPPRICPDVLTSEEAARFLRIDHLKDPKGYLYERRREGLLRGTQIGRDIRYLRTELLNLADRLTDENPR